MRYDHLGFPIPPEFDAAPAPAGATRPGGPARRASGPGPRKRRIVWALLGALILPAIVAPAAWPVVRELAFRWSVQRALRHEARGQSAAAIGAVGRALAWSGADPALTTDLLCWRAALRLDDRDPTGAAADAGRAISLAPTSVRPRSTRALVNVVLGRPDEALADAETAVSLAGRTDPDALNHRAYIRALCGRELPEALADVDAALAGGAEPAPEFLDTRAYVLHLLGRHQEAIDQLNLAIAALEGRRRDVAAVARAGDGIGAVRELRALDHSLAVMYHHRGLACRAAGFDRQAEQDFAIAERKGFDPRRGVM